MKKALAFLALAGFLFLTSCHKEEPQLSYAAELQKDIGLIDAYLTAHNITAVADTSGIRYVVTSLGTGALPTLSGNVVMSAQGMFLSNGAIFTPDTIARSTPVDHLIAGFQRALVRLPKGSRFTLYIPSGLGYGASGSGDGSVPGNANLIYDVHLYDDDAQLKADKAAIDQYLANESIVAIKDSSGLRYVINTAGSGENPTINSTVNVTYKGTFLGQFTPFAQSTSNLVISTLIEGWQIGLPYDKVGGTITLYLPSGLAYGPSGSGDGVIPPNANLVYTITLNAVLN
jgi:FKBP-type peptidyl-prolyl cis-trans isomerase